MERKVILAAGGLAFDRDGEIIERSPASEEAAGAIAKAICDHGGAWRWSSITAMSEPRPGDTLQAVRGHRYVPVLVDAGEQDLTSHVDFEALGRAARDDGVATTPRGHSGRWLERLGIRVARRQRSPARIPNACRRSTSRSTACATRSKWANCSRSWRIHSPEWPAPAGFARMTITYRAAAIGRCGGASTASSETASCDTFAHLYRPEDLEAFLAQVHARSVESRAAATSVSHSGRGSGRQADRASPSSGRPSFPSRPTVRAIELRQLYLLNEWRGRGAARDA